MGFHFNLSIFLIINIRVVTFSGNLEISGNLNLARKIRESQGILNKTLIILEIL